MPRLQRQVSCPFNLWDSTDLTIPDTTLFRARGGPPRAWNYPANIDLCNVIHDGVLENEQSDVTIAAWYARSDEPIDTGFAARSVVTFTMGYSPIRMVPLDHLLVHDVATGRRGERCEIVVPQRQTCDVRVELAPKFGASLKAHGRLWIHLVGVKPMWEQ